MDRFVRYHVTGGKEAGEHVDSDPHGAPADAGAALAELLARGPALYTLDLGGNNFSDAESAALFRGL